MKHLLSVLFIVILSCTAAEGEEVTFSFGGTVYELDGEFNYFTGHPFEIIYSFESTTDDADPSDPGSGAYIGAITSGSLTIYTDNGSFKWEVDPEDPHNIIEVKKLDAAVSYSAGASVSGPALGKEIPAHFRVKLTDRDAAALRNDELPSSLDIGSFDNNCIVEFTFIGSRQAVYSTLGRIRSGNTPVPHSGTGGE